LTHELGTGLILWRAITSGRAEATAQGWRVVCELVDLSRGWCAYIEPVNGGTRMFAASTFRDSHDGEQWCRAELARRCRIVRLAYGLEWPTPSSELRLTFLNLLRQCETLTAFELIVKTLIGWGSERARILCMSEASEEWPEELLAEEPTMYFWFAMNKMDFTDFVMGAPKGSVGLNPADIERLAEQWVSQLVQKPFYETIYTYTLAVHDWLSVCDLSLFVTEGANKLDAIKVCLKRWEDALSIY
jgi:hypothetical protein